MRLKLAGALIAALLVFGMVFGVGQAAAASLPGGPLYGLKLTAEDARMGLTSDPEAKAELATEFAENRLEEIGKMMAAGRAVDGETAHKAQQRISQAYQYMNQVEGEGHGELAGRLGTMLRSRHRFMAFEVNGMPEQQRGPVDTLLRSMEMVQAQVRVSEGQGSPKRNQEGDPAQPQPPDQPGAGPQAGQQDDGLLDGAGEPGQTGQGQGQMGPSDGETPGQGPAGQQNGSETEPNRDGSMLGPGPELQDGQQGPYSGEGPDYGPGPGEPTQEKESTGAGFQWLWNLFRKNPESGSSSSGSGSPGNGSPGSGSSGSGSSGGRP